MKGQGDGRDHGPRVQVQPAGEGVTWEAGYCIDLLPLNCANYDEFDRVIPAVLDFARCHRVGGVVTTFDAAIPAAAELASRLGLAGIPPAAAAALRDKSLMRRRFAELGLPSANSIPVRTLGEAASAAAEIGYPVIVKPRMGTGSTGVLLATSPDELRDFFATAQLAMQAANGRDELLIEEYLDGIEVCVDAVVANGELAPPANIRGLDGDDAVVAAVVAHDADDPGGAVAEEPRRARSARTQPGARRSRRHPDRQTRRD